MDAHPLVAWRPCSLEQLTTPVYELRALNPSHIHHPPDSKQMKKAVIFIIGYYYSKSYILCGSPWPYPATAKPVSEICETVIPAWSSAHAKKIAQGQDDCVLCVDLLQSFQGKDTHQLCGTLRTVQPLGMAGKICSLGGETPRAARTGCRECGIC